MKQHKFTEKEAEALRLSKHCAWAWAVAPAFRYKRDAIDALAETGLFTVKILDQCFAGIPDPFSHHFKSR